MTANRTDVINFDLGLLLVGTLADDLEVPSLYILRVTRSRKLDKASLRSPVSFTGYAQIADDRNNAGSDASFIFSY